MGEGGGKAEFASDNYVVPSFIPGYVKNRTWGRKGGNRYGKVSPRSSLHEQEISGVERVFHLSNSVVGDSQLKIRGQLEGGGK